jgi:glycosyltransferase involved in cell wall biosynthesis
MPTYSAIITAYNAGGFIHKAIESVLAQTVPPLEVLVVDDGSSDDTRDAVRRFPVQYIHRSNGGPAAARNTGMRHAQGEWLAFLDHDDTWYPEKSARQLALATPDVDAVFCEKSPNSDNISFLQMFQANYGGNPSGTMIRRSALEALGGFDEDRNLFIAEDYNLWLRFLLDGHRYRTCQRCYSYTPAPGHVSGDRERMLRAELTNIDKIAVLAGLDPKLVEERKRALRRNYLPDLIGIRQQKAARRYLFQAGFGARDLLKYTIACYSPTWALNLRRRVQSRKI